MRVRGQSAELRSGEWADRVVHAVEEQVRATAAAFESYDQPAPPVAETVDLVLAVLPKAHPNPLDAEIGPFYDTASVMALLGGVSRQAVDARRRKHTILALKTADARWVYPVFQFNRRDVNPALVPAIRAFADSPAWSAALWFVTPNPDLDDMSPLDWVRKQQPAEVLEQSANQTAREWR